MDNHSRTEPEKDHYKAHLENGELIMVPYCACGCMLNEDYFCENCGRKCRCYQIYCADAQTLELVQSYIRKSPQFSAYTAHQAEHG